MTSIRTCFTDAMKPYLDLAEEQERLLRYRVTYVGYQLMGAAMLLAMFYTAIISEQADAGYRATTMIGALLVFSTSVPTVILGWTLPDDDPEDFIDKGTEVD
jgi:hypothetical protein